MFDNPRQEPEQLRALRAQIRRFVQQKAPREKRREWDRSHTWPRELFAELAALGVCGLTIDERHGGHGMRPHVFAARHAGRITASPMKYPM